mmetsp:Transcript_12999/g.15258  ORF Transcript_12999/g.15258 Transcript_12999/m.15258 type:complete len:98 (-) Transcript_12999:497-790(-)
MTSTENRTTTTTSTATTVAATALTTKEASQPSPPPITPSVPVSVAPSCEIRKFSHTSDMEQMIRDETIRHLELAWEAQRSLAIRCMLPSVMNDEKKS